MSETISSADTSVDELMLRKLFDQCDDQLRTGHVRAVDLIDAIQVRPIKRGNCAFLVVIVSVVYDLDQPDLKPASVSAFDTQG